MPRTEFNSGAGAALACFWGLRLGLLRAQGNMLPLPWGEGKASAPLPISPQHILLERVEESNMGLVASPGTSHAHPAAMPPPHTT